jgi:hypothetical protein
VSHHAIANAAALLAVAIGVVVAIGMSFLGVWRARRKPDA